jgi:hypothetical protein
MSTGYWMPFEAAKAIAATFCWKIRYALTPLFGTDFPSLCIPPHSQQFGKMTIDPGVIQEATEMSNRYRQLELDLKARNRSQNLLMTPTTSAPQTMLYHQTWSAPIDSGSLDIAHQSHQNPTGVVHADREELRETQLSTVSGSSNTFTPINNPRGAIALLERKDSGRPHISQPRGSTRTPRMLPSLKEFIGFADFESSICANPLKRRLANDADLEPDAKLVSPRGQSLIASIPRRPAFRERGEDNRHEDVDDDVELDDDSGIDKMSIDDDESCSSSFYNFDSEFESESDAESDIGISSSVPSDSSDEDAKRKIRSRYKKSHGKKHTHGLATRKLRRRVSLYRAEGNVSSPSPPAAAPIAVSSSSSKRKPKNHSHRDDLKAAETLLALHSGGSSTLSGEDDTDTSSSPMGNKVNYNKKKKKNKTGHHRHRVERVPGRSSLAVNSQSELFERTVKRVRRASF